MRSTLIQAARGILVSTVALACSSSSAPSVPKGRGTSACNEWQAAICAWASRCSSPSASICQEQANSISCNSDQKALDCATAFNAAPCTSLPPACQFRDLADPAPAVAACQQLIDESCAGQVRCVPSTMSDQCHQEANTKVDCTKMIGVKLSFEQCISDLKTLSCQATMSPASCPGALVSGE